MTILKYVRKKRIEKACRLLVETNDTVEAICEEVGYGDLKYFYSLFRLKEEVESLALGNASGRVQR